MTDTRLFRHDPEEARRDPQQDAWVARTEALLQNFEEAAPEHVSPALGFVVIAADFLWAQHKAQADFGKLDTHAFTEACWQLIGNEEALSNFANTLTAFYEFLGTRGLIHPRALELITEELRALPSLLK
jgi:hypothetical protein